LRSFSRTAACSEFSTLSLHDALPIFALEVRRVTRECLSPVDFVVAVSTTPAARRPCSNDDDAPHQRSPSEYIPHIHLNGTIAAQDRKSTRLNSSHVKISYAVFCLKKK